MTENSLDINDGILNDVWTIYFHDPYDDDWTLSSYQKLTDISSIDDFWNVQSVLKNKIHLGMFFLMRDYIFHVGMINIIVMEAAYQSKF